MTLQRFALVAFAAGLFWAGHSLGADTPLPSRPAITTTAASESIIAATVRRGRARREAEPDLGPALLAARARANSPIAIEVRATIHESAAHREARHRYISEEADRLAAGLDPAKREQLLALSDRNEEQFRSARASFMLGDVSEDDYIAGLKQLVRDAFEETKTFLSPLEVATLEGNPDSDPFDRDIPDVPGTAPYLSREEAAALAADPTPSKDERSR